jgi:hypothetical protein
MLYGRTLPPLGKRILK